MQTGDSQPPASGPRQNQPPRRDLPAWVFALVILVCLAGGAGIIWWFFAGSSPLQVQKVSIPDDVPRTSDDLLTDGYVPPSFPIIEIPAATLINADWTQLPLREALHDLSQQTGYPIRLLDSRNRRWNEPITLHVQQQPFWDVVQHMARQVPLQPEPDFDAKGTLPFQNVRADATAVPITSEGIFRLQPHRIYTTSTADLDKDSITRELTVFPRVSVEPIPTVRFFAHVALDEAIDEQGRSLMTDQRLHPIGRAVQRYSVISPQIKLQYIPDARRISRLKGHVSAIACESLETMEVHSPLESGIVSHKVEHLVLSFAEIKRTAKFFVARFEVRGGLRHEHAIKYRFRADVTRMELYDANGLMILGHSGGGLGGDDPYVFHVHFDIPPEWSGNPARLVVYVPHGLREIRVPFEFTDLPIP